MKLNRFCSYDSPLRAIHQRDLSHYPIVGWGVRLWGPLSHHTTSAENAILPLIGKVFPRVRRSFGLKHHKICDFSISLSLDKIQKTWSVPRSKQHCVKTGLKLFQMAFTFHVSSSMTILKNVSVCDGFYHYSNCSNHGNIMIAIYFQFHIMIVIIYMYLNICYY